jgi:hypothetical protein
MIKNGDFETPTKATKEDDDSADMNRRESLGRLVKYTAPALLAVLMSTDKGTAGFATSGGAVPADQFGGTGD